MMFRIPLFRAVLLILLSIVVITGGTVALWRYYRQNKQERINNPDYYLTNIVQAPREVLKSGFFEELFDLSVDQPTSCYGFNVEAAQRKLDALIAMRTAHVKVLPPHTVYVEYSLRTPIAYLANRTNTLLDMTGVTFPAEPFFTPKRLPEFYLDLDDEHSFATALAVNDESLEAGFRVKRVDLAWSNAPHCGRREIVVLIECNGAEHCLRLDPDAWKDGFRRYKSMVDELKGGAVVDLRIQNMAFIEPVSTTG